VPEPKGRLVTPVGFTAAGKMVSMLLDVEGRQEVVTVPRTSAKARAYLSANQEDISHNTSTKVLLNGTSFDPSSIFAANKFTIKVPGYYYTTGHIRYLKASVVADKAYYVGIWKNGAAIIWHGVHASLTSKVDANVTDCVHLNVDDYLELYAHHEAGVDTIDVEAGSDKTFFTAHLLSAD